MPRHSKRCLSEEGTTGLPIGRALMASCCSATLTGHPARLCRNPRRSHPSDSLSSSSQPLHPNGVIHYSEAVRIKR